MRPGSARRAQAGSGLRGVDAVFPWDRAAGAAGVKERSLMCPLVQIFKSLGGS